MKFQYAFKVFFVVVFGVLAGEGLTRDTSKWHALGRDAFMAAQSQRYERDMAHPVPVAFYVLGTTLLLLLFMAVYEVFGIAGAKCTSLIVDTLRQR